MRIVPGCIRGSSGSRRAQAGRGAPAGRVASGAGPTSAGVSVPVRSLRLRSPTGIGLVLVGQSGASGLPAASDSLSSMSGAITGRGPPASFPGCCRWPSNRPAWSASLFRAWSSARLRPSSISSPVPWKGGEAAAGGTPPGTPTASRDWRGLRISFSRGSVFSSLAVVTSLIFARASSASSRLVARFSNADAADEFSAQPLDRVRLTVAHHRSLPRNQGEFALAQGALDRCFGLFARFREPAMGTRQRSVG